MRYLIALLVFGTIILTSCKESSKPSTKEPTTTLPATPPPSPESSLDKVATGELMNMVNAYYILKDALVATDGAKADEAASKLMSSAEIFLAEHANSTNNPQLRPEVQVIMKKSEGITSSKPENIEDKRARFAEISEALYKVVTAAKLQHAGIYHTYCPMAFDSKGAYWLSAESEIKNPYFGKKMMECGEVRDSL